jgi:tRNA pseudouridine55 synthase
VNQVNGVVVIDKPAGWTSHDVVARCRRFFGQKQVGHAGTLDPDATGVLVVGLGQATRLLQFLSGLPKRYTGEVVLGVATTTLDSSGAPVASFDMTSVTLDEARAAAAKLTGEITQVPPMVSAVKVGGRRLYDLARAGIEVDRAPRKARVERFDVALSPTRIDQGPVLSVDIECSGGTYVRALAADLGELLGGGAHLRNLRRLAVGGFSVDQAVSLEALGATPDPARFVLTPAAALAHLSRAVAGPRLSEAVSHGQVLPLEVLYGAGATGGGPWAVIAASGELLAVYRPHGERLAKPVVVLQAGSPARLGR